MKKSSVTIFFVEYDAINDDSINSMILCYTWYTLEVMSVCVTQKFDAIGIYPPVSGTYLS